MAQLVDFIPDDKYDRYNYILNVAEKAKSEAPKTVKPRGPLSAETKKKMAESRLAKAQAALDALLASENA